MNLDKQEQDQGVTSIRETNILYSFNYVLQLGGATGHIGDPSGKSTDRVALASNIIADNIACIKSNLETVFENHKKYIWSEDEDKLKPLRYFFISY